MENRRARREQRRALADRLVVDYAGALPPGQVLATFFRADHALARRLDLPATARLSICESAVRRLLTDRLAGTSRGVAPA